VKRIQFCRITLLMGVAVACGCTVTYPVVGQFDAYNEVVLGEVNSNLMTGTAFIRARTEHSGIECTGSSRVVHIPASNYFIPGYCRGQIGEAELRCSDGRQISTTFEALSCKRGFGKGYDENGAGFSFTFGMKRQEALAYIAKAKVSAYRSPHLYVFSIA